MIANNLKATIVSRIDALKASEKITKAELSAVSRECLLYVPDSDDIDVVNRLLNVLTPMNRATAVLFFRHFLMWEFEEDADRFGAKLKKEKQVKRKQDLIDTFLANEDNDIWTWAKTEVTVDYKPKQFAAQITKAVQAALKGEVKDNGETPPLSPQDVVAAVLIGGITVVDMIEVAQQRAAEMEEAEKETA